ncbi:hypothetical protein ACEPAH_5210 [Sanghuangporus vaninii]
MDNATNTGESHKTESHEGDKAMLRPASVAVRVPDDLEFLMNFFLTTPTSSPIELQPAEPGFQEVMGTDNHTNAAAPAARTTAVVQTEPACSAKMGSSSASNGKSRKGNRANRINQRPCSDCQRQQKKVLRSGPE